MGLSKLSKHYGLILTSMVGILFFVLAQKHYFDQLNYTFRIATALLNGELGITTSPSWLNEMVPIGNYYYSVFPLGAILSVMPFSWITKFGIVNEYPVALVVALLAAGCVGFAFFYTYIRSDLAKTKRALLSLWLVHDQFAICRSSANCSRFCRAGTIGRFVFQLCFTTSLFSGAVLCLGLWQQNRNIIIGSGFYSFFDAPLLEEETIFSVHTLWLKASKAVLYYSIGFRHLNFIL